MSARTVTKQLHNAQMTLADPGASGTIVVDKSVCIVNLESAAAETRTLGLPTREGVLVSLHMQVDTGDITLTVASAYTEAGDTTYTFSEVGQTLTLQSFQTTGGVYFWRMISNSATGSLASLTATAAELNARAAAASRIVNVTDAATYTVLAADSGKIHIMPDFTQDCTLSLPAVSAGLEYTFIGKGVAADAHSWIFKSASATNFFLGGASHTDTDDPADTVVAVYSNGSSNDFHTVLAAGGGTRVYMICDGTNWIVSTQVNGATAPTFSDT